MAGLLAAAMLREEATAVLEAQAGIPHNHTALLRFRSSVVGDALNIPFRRVEVLKAIAPWRNPVADIIAYSAKTNGHAAMRSIVSANGGRTEARYIAPTDLVEQMARKVMCPIRMGVRWAPGGAKEPTISTIPMHHLMQALGWKRRATFDHIAGWNILADLHGTDAYCTLYVPSDETAFSRVSITGNRLIAECYGQHEKPDRTELEKALALVGLDMDWVQWSDIVPQKYAKLLPIDEGERRRFITWASREFNVYSLGRFATWRPHLLLDDVVNDIRVIQRLAKASTAEIYDHLKKPE